ncbi:MAG: hypothetical protein ACRDL5_07235, partial [Solirubrobacteraceae bacterium]
MRAREPQAATNPRGVLELAPAGAPARITISSPRAWVGLCGLLATALVIALSAAHTQMLIPQSLRAVPQ